MRVLLGLVLSPALHLTGSLMICVQHVTAESALLHRSPQQADGGSEEEADDGDNLHSPARVHLRFLFASELPLLSLIARIQLCYLIPCCATLCYAVWRPRVTFPVRS